MAHQRGIGLLGVVGVLALALVLPASAQLPEGFFAKDIGEVGAVGSTTYDPATGKWTIKGAGDYQNEVPAEGIQFAYKVVKGDGSIIARLVEQGTEDGTTPKTGIMIRANDTAGSPYVGLIVTTSTIALQYRDEQDADSVRVSDQAERVFPTAFLRLQRVGNELSAFTSPDGRLWKPIDEAPRTIASLGETALFGMAVSARAVGILAHAIFDNVAVLEGQVTVSGLKGAKNDKGTLIEWNAVKGAVGYNIYRGALDAGFAQLKKLNADPQTAASYLDATPEAAAPDALTYAVAAVFTGADGKPVEGPALRVP